MNQDMTGAKIQDPSLRITRARAKALSALGALPPLNPSLKRVQKEVLQKKSKREASDENKPVASVTTGLQNKKRAFLRDVTNICDYSQVNCIRSTKVQISKQARQCTGKVCTKAASTFVKQIPEATAELAETRAENTEKLILEENVTVQSSNFISTHETSVTDQKLVKRTSNKNAQVESTWQIDKGKLCKKLEPSDGVCFTDIDSDHKDPMICSLYAPDIYDNLRVTELDGRGRPLVDYMERLQRDITPCMRGILIDWLVEVSEEYRLVPDTLYLTVNLIDRFLSKNYIEKQRLQLLGVTCMLIASKYDEICAPRVEEFCFITDNTYKKGEVLKLESQVLNILGFQLSVPTTKKFLRRFIQAAQVSYEVPSVELEFLANYLAELTLLEYSFLKFLPSLISASAVFLARWTLDPSENPWNRTLEHYTNYKASELQATVLALQDLQLNTRECTPAAIREKYRQQKYKCVANLSSTRLVQFQDWLNLL